jgi:HD-GYP domain-containing protein (c-di-GMP phosphodiesterase class II)
MTISATEIEQYIPVSLATISPSEATNFPLFIREDPDTPIHLYRDADYPFEAKDIQRLIDRGVKRLYVALYDHEQYQQYLRENFASILKDESLPVERRFGCLNEIVRDVLAEAFSTRNTTKTVETASEMAAQTVELICRTDVMALELMKVLHHDYHTFTHSANVSYYSVLLAKASGITDQNDLQQIATGALLHDLGKLDIPEAILKKRGRLNEHEWEVIKDHPTNGLRELASRDDLNFAQLMMIYQHHERLDGTGYPVGVSETSIHPWAQICAIVDVYEALTSNRPYRPGLPKKDTIAILDRQAGPRLNQGLWQCWKKIIQNS